MKRNLCRILPVLILTVIISYLVPSRYIIIAPGSALDLKAVVRVEDHETGEDRGSFLMVTVGQRPARNMLLTAVAYLHPSMRVEHISRIIPADMTQEDYRELLNQLMLESQALAKAVAVRRAGYEVDITSEGVVVIGFTEDSPSKGKLEHGDLIVQIDGKPVHLASEVVAMVRSRPVGEPVRVTIDRGGKLMELTIDTEPGQDDPALPIMGVYIRTRQWEPDLPFEIHVDTGNIGGPSAGIMLVLEILNQLLEEDISTGRVIAGTGTIDLDENVGRIGGVYQKVIAAESQRAEYFIVPEENYQEAKKAARSIELVPVNTVQDVLDFLDQLD